MVTHCDGGRRNAELTMGLAAVRLATYLADNQGSPQPRTQKLTNWQLVCFKLLTRNNQMKLTKTKLKQLIQEELEKASLTLEMFNTSSQDGEQIEEEAITETSDSVWWINMTQDLLKKAQDIYRQAPPDGQKYITKNFEAYFQKWEEELQASEPRHEAIIPRADLIDN